MVSSRRIKRLDPGSRAPALASAAPVGPTSEYEGDWLTDVRKIGAENYYPPLQM